MSEKPYYSRMKNKESQAVDLPLCPPELLEMGLHLEDSTGHFAAYFLLEVITLCLIPPRTNTLPSGKDRGTGR